MLALSDSPAVHQLRSDQKILLFCSQLAHHLFHPPAHLACVFQAGIFIHHLLVAHTSCFLIPWGRQRNRQLKYLYPNSQDTLDLVVKDNCISDGIKIQC